ncbi:MAG: AMP-binding protein, partial [Gaiellales bacterium]
MKTVAEIWRSALERHSGAAYLVQDGDGWSPLSWSEASRSIDELALGLMSLGIGRGDRVAVLSRTRVEWTLCDWALLGIGAIVVPIYPTCSPDDVTYILADSEAVAVICEDAEQLGRTRRAAHRLGCLAHFVTIEPAGGDGAHLLADLQAEGAARAVADPAAAVRARDGLGAEDVATIVYTSGTTGEPKGCVLTHGNLCAAVSSVRRVPDLVRGDDTIVLFLPLAHAFGRLCQFAGAEIGGTIAFCPDVALVAQTLVSV